jgi:hypothetical protein
VLASEGWQKYKNQTKNPKNSKWKCKKEDGRSKNMPCERKP